MNRYVTMAPVCAQHLNFFYGNRTPAPVVV
jgi:hypothetical protein